MPILHRNIVPNVPALAADNGKIVFRDGKPSHQKKVKFWVEFDWAPDFCTGSWWGQFLPSGAQWLGLFPSLARLETSINSPHYDAGFAGVYYNSPATYQGGEAGYYNVSGVCQDVSLGVYPYDYQVGYDCQFVLDWSAAATGWRWHVYLDIPRAMRVARIWHEDTQDYEYVEVVGAADISADFRSALLTNDIRPGAGGIALDFHALSSNASLLNATGATLYSEHTA